MFLFLPLSLQNMFVFHYDQNLTGSGQYVQPSIGEPAANTRTAAKPKQQNTFTETKISLCRRSETMNRINKWIEPQRRFHI